MRVEIFGDVFGEFLLELLAVEPVYPASDLALELLGPENQPAFVD